MPKCKCGCGAEVSEGKEFLPGHYAKWKAVQSKSVKELSTALDNTNMLSMGNDKTKWYSKLFFWRKEVPILLSQEKILAQKTELQTLTDEQKFFKFFSTLPKWTAGRPSRFEKWLMRKRTPTEFEIKEVVFVDEEGDHRQAFIPFNPFTNMLFTDTQVFATPIKGAPIFLDVKRYTPLMNRLNYKDEFDLPEDVAYEIYNTGVSFGRLGQFKALIEAINKLFSLKKWVFILMFVFIIYNFYVSYSYENAFTALADNIGNLTRKLP